MADLVSGEPYLTVCPNCDHAVKDHPLEILTLADLARDNDVEHTCAKCDCPMTRDYVVRAIMICSVYAYERDLKE